MPTSSIPKEAWRKLPSKTKEARPALANKTNATCNNVAGKTDQFKSKQKLGTAKSVPSFSVLPEETSKTSEVMLKPTHEPKEVKEYSGQKPGDPLRFSELEADVFAYWKELEERCTIREHFLKRNSEVTSKHRAILVNWIHELSLTLCIKEETFYKAVYILDSALQAQPVPLKNLQLMAVTALFVASKYEETCFPDVNDLVYLAVGAVKKSQILTTELLLLRTLDFQLGRPGALDFLRRYSRTCEVDKRGHVLAKCFLEIGAYSYKLAHVPPSMMAAAATVLSARTLGKKQSWNASLRVSSGFAENEVSKVADSLAEVIVRVWSSELKSVKLKYSKALRVLGGKTLTMTSRLGSARLSV